MAFAFVSVVVPDVVLAELQNQLDKVQFELSVTLPTVTAQLASISVQIASVNATIAKLHLDAFTKQVNDLNKQLNDIVAKMARTQQQAGLVQSSVDDSIRRVGTVVDTLNSLAAFNRTVWANLQSWTASFKNNSLGKPSRCLQRLRFLRSADICATDAGRFAAAAQADCMCLLCRRQASQD